MGNFREDFSRMLRSARAAQKLTQSQVAEVLQINRSTYTYYETGCRCTIFRRRHSFFRSGISMKLSR